MEEIGSLKEKRGFQVRSTSWEDRTIEIAEDPLVDYIKLHTLREDSRRIRSVSYCYNNATYQTTPKLNSKTSIYFSCVRVCGLAVDGWWLGFGSGPVCPVLLGPVATQSCMTEMQKTSRPHALPSHWPQQDPVAEVHGAGRKGVRAHRAMP